MPCIISTPEDWFRAQQRDLYIIQYRAPYENNMERPEEYDEDEDVDESPFQQAQKELNAWFDERVPHTPLRIIGSSEYSGYIIGGPTYFTADLDEHGFALFKSEWDENSSWYVEVWQVSDWQKRINAVQLLPSPVIELQRMRWWDVPQGILLLSAYTSNYGYCENGLLSLEDGWWKLQQLFPELSEHQADTFPCGQFWPFRMDNKSVTDIFVEFVWDQSWDSNAYVKNPQNLKRLKEAIGIPENVTTQMSIYDF